MLLDFSAIVIACVYIIQVIELVFFPLPSEVSTYEILTGNGDSNNSPGSLQNFKSVGHFAIAVAGTVLSLLTFVVPAAIIIYPPAHSYLVPIEILNHSAVFSLGLASMGIGSLITLVAVIQISRFKSANSGESGIYQEGMYGFCRHPISLGLILIVIGFFLRFPSLGLLAGMTIFIANVIARITWEERVLLERHGEAIRAYYAETGRFWPNTQL